MFNNDFYPLSSTRTRGFTLIEMLIVVALIAILAAVAVPSYQESVRKGFRAECRAGMMAAMQAQERFFAANATYTANLGSIYNTFSGDNAAASACNLSAAACGSGLTACVRISATTRRADPTCASFSLDSTNLRAASDSSAGDTLTKCW